jgi:quinolinate synthase
VATEIGILHTLQKQNPAKTFLPVARAAQCEFMKKITVEKILWSLQSLKHRITVAPDLAAKARRAIDRMLSA